MQKEELRRLKRINATPLMVKLAKENDLEKPIVYETAWNKVKKKTRYDMFIRCQTRGKILMIGLFFPKDLAKGMIIPAYELYLNPEGDEFITRIMYAGQEIKWSTAKMENLNMVSMETNIGYGWYMRIEDINSRIWQNKQGKATIQKFLKTKEKGWKGIREWQDKARDEQIARKERQQQEPWDKDMALVPEEVLPGFKRWTEHDATRQHYIFYEYDRKEAKTGYCTYCEKQVPVIKPRHNKKTVCGCCKKEVIFKTTGKIKTLRRDDYYTECIQKTKGGFVIRTFRNYSYWNGRTPEDPHRVMFEEERYLAFDNGICRHYTWGLYKNKKHRWIPSDSGLHETYYYDIRTKLYTRNLSALKKSVLKNSAIDCWEELPCGTAKYLYIERGNPAVEKLARIGMFRLAKELIKVSYTKGKDIVVQDATELTKMLQIDKARLKRLKKMDGNLCALRWVQYEKLANTIWPDDMIKDFSEAGIDAHEGNLGFLPTPLHFVKIWNYMRKQAELCGESIRQTRITWSDYVNMADTAKWNTKAEQILYPKNLKEAHTNVILHLKGNTMKEQAKKLEKKWPKVNGILPTLKKFEYAQGKYLIKVPDSILDIVKEGESLNHCVHTCDFYFDRIQKNESYLFFLRKEAAPDTPWYTLEVEPSGNIRQKRTTGDNQNKDFEEAVNFLKKWQKEFKKRMTDEEKKLGEIADQARLKEYEKLRKDGNRIWHGKLAGKLLVDVLEADFMQAM